MASGASADTGAAFCRRATVARCPICESPRQEPLAEGEDWLFGLPGRFTVVRCGGCGLGYLADPPVPEDLHLYYPEGAYYAYKKPAAYALFHRSDPVAAIWYAAKKGLLAREHGYRHLGGSRLLATLLVLPFLNGLRGKASFELRVLLHPWVAEGALLEVGCGAGMYLDLMRALGWKRVVGVDFSETAIRSAREELKLEAYCGELSGVGLEANSFDAVSLSHTLEHIPNPLAFLAELRRLMKPGGRLAIVVPNLESTCARVYEKYWMALDPPRHVVDFTSGSLRLALERAGFGVESISTSPASARDIALVSNSRRKGDARAIHTDPQHRFGPVRRLSAWSIGAWERLACGLGKPAGEEILAVARKPASA
jgi:SAM-dependent methyltransferase